jgi:hypothetical protein
MMGDSPFSPLGEKGYGGLGPDIHRPRRDEPALPSPIERVGDPANRSSRGEQRKGGRRQETRHRRLQSNMD